jgi:ribosomal protein S18 acetylase RimI-like enzyme
MSGDGVYVRRATSADVDAILWLERRIEVAPHWPRDSYTAMLAESHGKSDGEAGVARALFVGVRELPQDKLRVVGFAVASAICTADAAGVVDAELESVAVEVDYRRQGLGWLLCTEVIAWARGRRASCLNLEVREGSAAAIALYRSLGFLDIGRRPKYYKSPDDDALLMRLDLRAERISN